MTGRAGPAIICGGGGTKRLKEPPVHCFCLTMWGEDIILAPLTLFETTSIAKDTLGSIPASDRLTRDVVGEAFGVGSWASSED